MSLSVRHRDTGVFAPGSEVAIDMPSPIDGWLGSGDSSIPLLEVPNGLFVVDQHSCVFTMPQVPVSQEVSHMQAFHLHCSMMYKSRAANEWFRVEHGVMMEGRIVEGRRVVST